MTTRSIATVSHGIVLWLRKGYRDTVTNDRLFAIRLQAATYPEGDLAFVLGHMDNAYASLAAMATILETVVGRMTGEEASDAVAAIAEAYRK